MAGRVVVVTDSTAYLPDGVADRLSIRVVPLQVVLGGRSGTEGDEDASIHALRKELASFGAVRVLVK